MSWILCLSLLLCLMVQTALGDPHAKGPLAATKYGLLQGKQMHVAKTNINVFLGVPFSKPPVGTRRFTAPEAPEPWKGIRHATTHAPACLQESWGQVASMYFSTGRRYQWLRSAEDCLYLDVYAPARAPGDALLPVMVWVPGGAFLVGAASTYDGAELAAREQVVVVLLQYRLGILGFLSTGDSQARGNWALLDQIEALRWVQKNIAAFGGDPGCVTLFGQSAGAFCISGLMMSPLARGLFHRAISQSGTAVLRNFINPDPLEVAKKIADLAGCKHNSTQILVECLRALPVAKMMHVSKKMRFFHFSFQKDPKEIMWFMSPVVDGVVFPDNPVALLTQGQVAPVPYLLGVNNLEFNWVLPYIMKIPLSRHTMRKETLSKILWSTSTVLNITKEQIPLVMEEYMGETDGGDWKMLRNRLMDLATDAVFVSSTLWAARCHHNAGFPVYLYEFMHHAPTTIIIKPRTDGADHGDEIYYIFGTPFLKGHSTGEERALSSRMMRYWANFARTGKYWELELQDITEGTRAPRGLFPLKENLITTWHNEGCTGGAEVLESIERNPNDKKLPYWPRYDKDEKYLQLDYAVRVGVKLKEEKVAFWTRLHQNTGCDKQKHF